MIAQAPFVFSIGALNLSLAGLAGLVATLRRGSAGEFPALDRFRLREIVEFSFANALLALALVPMATTIGDVEVTVRILGAGALAYQLTSSLLLRRRQLARELRGAAELEERPGGDGETGDQAEETGPPAARWRETSSRVTRRNSPLTPRARRRTCATARRAWPRTRAA